jgi:putative colanic acid biosysnthesis UDP-glucose lipid carrier transferase
MKNSIVQAHLRTVEKVDPTEILSIVYGQNTLKPLVLPHQLPLDKKINLAVKRLVDIIVSSVLILGLLTWLMPLISLLIKINSRGPVFFKQKRATKNGRLFTCIKFRTMIQNGEADSMPAAIGDQRITTFGRFLRENHLDELPQLFNVWLGDMSLIGPRPHMISDNQKYEELLSFYSYRHKIKPGITGLAQAYGYVGAITSVEGMKERVKKDIYYIHHWSLLLDAKIAGRTLLKIAGIKK